MAELKDKLVSLEGLQIFYNAFADAGRIPAFDAQNESMVLAIKDGIPQWVRFSVGTITPVVDRYFRFTNDMITNNPQKVVNGEATWTYNETTHDLSVTFTDVSQGILLYDPSKMIAGSTVNVYFDSVEFNPELSGDALDYIGLYDNKVASTQGYYNVSGAEVSWDGTNKGVQVNTSSKYVTPGNGTVPITITYRNIGYTVNGRGPGDSGTTPPGTTTPTEHTVLASNVIFSGDAKQVWSGSWSTSKSLYVELTLDQQTTNLGNVLSFGSNISSWDGSTSQPHVHIYFPIDGSRTTIEVAALAASNTTLFYRPTFTNNNEILRVACSMNGIYINGTQMTSADITSFLNSYSSISTMEVGSREGNNRYTGTYNEVRAYNKALSLEEMQELTLNGTL